MPNVRLGAAGAALAMGMTVAALAGAWTAGQSDAAAAGGQERGLATRLRYIGRDGLTGLPATVNERFITDHELAMERYGKDEREPVPPPPATGRDIAALRIPDLGVDAAVQRYGVDGYGRLDVPQDRVTVGWNPAFSTVPGEGRSTFLAAHYTFGGQPGVFHELSSLGPGAGLVVMLSDGSSVRYEVTSTVDYPLEAIDMGALLRGLEGAESLVLMTCSGPLSADGEYQLRTVVLAKRAD